jgi:hypothetical protein
LVAVGESDITLLSKIILKISNMEFCRIWKLPKYSLKIDNK